MYRNQPSHTGVLFEWLLKIQIPKKKVLPTSGMFIGAQQFLLGLPSLKEVMKWYRDRLISAIPTDGSVLERECPSQCCLRVQNTWREGEVYCSLTHTVCHPEKVWSPQQDLLEGVKLH